MLHSQRHPTHRAAMRVRGLLAQGLELLDRVEHSEPLRARQRAQRRSCFGALAPSIARGAHTCYYSRRGAAARGCE